MIDTLERLRPRIEESSILERLGLKPVCARHASPPGPHRGPLFQPPCQPSSDSAWSSPWCSPCTRERGRESREAPRGRTRDSAPGSPSGTSTSLRSRPGRPPSSPTPGGFQEETHAHLGVPCFTLRENTERPVTVEAGHEHAGRPRAGAAGSARSGTSGPHGLRYHPHGGGMATPRSGSPAPPPGGGHLSRAPPRPLARHPRLTAPDRPCASGSISANSPHVPAVRPRCRSPARRRPTFALTARDHAQTVELARHRWPDVGRAAARARAGVAQGRGDPAGGRCLRGFASRVRPRRALPRLVCAGRSRRGPPGYRP